MRTVDIAAKRLKFGREVRRAGEPVPESKDFPNRDYLLRSGRLKEVPFDELSTEQKRRLAELTGLPEDEKEPQAAHEPEPEPENAPTIRHIGGGWYELADGTRVQGKEAAEAAALEHEGSEL